MKRILFALLIIITGFTARSHTIMPFVGGGASAYTLKARYYSSYAMPALNVGAAADIILSSRFSFQPALCYSQLGGKNEDMGSIGYKRLVYRVNAVQMPVMLIFKMGHEGGGRFFVGAGGYVTANLGGSVMLEEDGDPAGYYRAKIKMQAGSDKDYAVQRCDFGLNVGTGYHFANGVEFYAFYQQGMADILTGYFKPGSRTYQYGLSLRYAIKLRKQKTGPQKAGS